MTNNLPESRMNDCVYPNCNCGDFKKFDLQDHHETIASDSSEPVTEDEIKERKMLLDLQKDSTRWFSQEEFNRLTELSKKMFINAGAPPSRCLES